MNKHGNLIDLSGQKFSMLTVLDKIKSKKYKNGTQVYWLCKCECGKEKYIAATKIKSGHTKSCGCYRKEFKKLESGRAALNVVFDDYQRNAIKRDFKFELNMEEFRYITQLSCHYCGCEPSNRRQTKRMSGEYRHNGIDRLDSKVGYIKDNCVPCCTKCNRMKWANSEEDFLNQVKNIYNHRFKNA